MEEGPVRGDAGVPVVVRVVLDDRPGALGAVASRIGAVGADVVGVEIVERGPGYAVDELTVLLPEEVPTGLLRREVGEVDRVRVEQIRPAPEGWDPLVAMLTLAVRLAVPAPGTAIAALVDGLRSHLGASWACVLAADGSVLQRVGSLPSLVEAGEVDVAGMVDDETAVADLTPGAVVAIGRPGVPFRWRERETVRLLACLVADRVDDHRA